MARRPYFWGGGDGSMKVEIREVRDQDLADFAALATKTLWDGRVAMSQADARRIVPTYDLALTALNCGVVVGFAIRRRPGVNALIMVKDHYRNRGVEAKLERAVSRG